MEDGSGWLRWSRGLQRIDAHCPGHAQEEYAVKCKLDRKATRGSLGLSLAWLQKGLSCSCSEDHNLQKELLPDSSAFGSREEARDAFKAKAEVCEEAAVVVALERESRSGDDSEPLSIPCQSMLAKHLRSGR